jgi:site-specific DNA-cytosine methylase
MTKVPIYHAHACCGLGGGAQGFNEGSARVGNLEADFICLGGIDVDPAGLTDFERATGVKGTLMDLFTAGQYRAFHGKEPPKGWHEATPADLRAAYQNITPHIYFTSSPCKGLSGLLNETLSKTSKYQALNELTLRTILLACEAYKDDPIPLIIFENVPRISSRGRHLLDQIIAVLRHYGYSVAETTHDCGEIGELAQSRKRYLLVARHMEKVPPFLYEPPKRPLRSVGEVLGRYALPGDPAAGPMHRIPALQWKTWVRLAFVQAGKDWRSLNRLQVEDGRLRDYLIVPEYHGGYMGVIPWDQPSGAITGRSSPSNGKFSIADPRFSGHEYSQYGVLPWESHAGAISGQSAPGGGKFSVADPRCNNWHPGASSKKYAVVKWDHFSGTVIGAQQVASGALSVADPRRAGPTYGKYMVTDWSEPAGTVIGGSTTGQGAYAVADPRPAAGVPVPGDHYLTGGHYGVVPWDSHTGAVSGSACHDNGRWSVADPRVDQLADVPAANEKLVAIIRAEDGTWHRPMTTLDMAALQSLYDPDDYAEGEVFELAGNSDEAKRERIGNAVPRATARAIASMMGKTILLAMSGETFMLSSTPVWVKPIAVALSVAQGARQ